MQSAAHSAGAKPKFWRLRCLPPAVTESRLQKQLEQSCLKHLRDHNAHQNAHCRVKLVSQAHRKPVAIVTCCHQPLFDPTTELDEKFVGITTVHTSNADSVDLVIVPGLGGHPLGSFRSQSGWHAWPLDFLPNKIKSCRVLTYGYDSVVLRNEDKSSVDDLAKSLLETLIDFRRRTQALGRPIVFIGHSLGGLVVKQALVIASQESSKSGGNRDAVDSTYGLMFFGVPNLGLRHEQLKVMVGRQPNEQLIRDLVTDNDTEPSPYLKQLKQQFIRLCEARPGQFNIVSYYERKTSSTVQQRDDGSWSKSGPPMIAVTEQSATSIGFQDNFSQNLPRATDHSGLVRFNHSEEAEYEQVEHRLQVLVEKAIGVVGSRLAFEQELTSEQMSAWMGFNQPPYDAFRNSERLVKASRGTLKWVTDEVLEDYPRVKRRRLIEENTFRRSDLISWRDSPGSQTLLIMAPPGSGKSVLSGYILDNLDANVRPSTRPCKVIYYFCNIKNDEKDRTAVSIIKALIVQLCEKQSSLFDQIPLGMVKTTESFHSASVDQLWDIFSRMRAKCTAYDTIYCVIDGLDVYESAMDILFDKLNRSTKATYAEKGPDLKLLCTTRPYNHILGSLDQAKHRRLLCNEDDIAMFIEERISRTRNLGGDQKRFARELLLERGEQTFLWLDVVIRELETLQFPNSSDIDDKIRKRHSDLDQLYHDLITKALNGSVKIARILVWVLHARRPLTTAELSSAISIDPGRHYRSHEECSPSSLDSSSLQAFLGTLLDVVEDEVFLIHQSLQDWLKRHDDLLLLSINSTDIGGPEHRLHIDTSRLVLAYSCLTYLALDKETDAAKCAAPKEYESFFLRHETLEDYPLLEYAAECWDSHIDTKVEVKHHLSELSRITSTGSLNTLLWTYIIWDDWELRELDPIPWPIQIALALNSVWFRDLVLDGTLVQLNSLFSEEVMIKVDSVFMLQILEHSNSSGYLISRPWLVELVAVRFSAKHLKALLDPHGNKIPITQKALIAAAKNDGHDPGVLKLLLRQPGIEVHITEAVLDATMDPGFPIPYRDVMYRSGSWRDRLRGARFHRPHEQALDRVELLGLLLDRAGDGVKITERFMMKVVRNPGEGGRIFKLLLDRRGKNISVTNSLVMEAAKTRQGWSVLEQLLDHGSEDVKITEDILVAATCWKTEDIRMLLERTGSVDQIITSKVVEAAAWTYRLETAMLLLEKGGENIEISTCAVVRLLPDMDADQFQKLFYQKRGKLRITDNLLIAAMGDRGPGVLQWMLDQENEKFLITERVLLRAVARYDETFTKVLLDKRGNEVRITEAVLELAVQHTSQMRLLLDRRGEEIVITEEVLKSAAKYEYGVTNMELLLGRRGSEIRITKDVLIAAARNMDMMLLLVHRRGEEIRLTEDVIIAVIHNPHDEGAKLLKHLLDERGDEIQITEDVLIAAAENFKVMDLLLRRRGAQIRITERVWRAAASDIEVMMLLARQRSGEIRVTEDLLIAIPKRCSFPDKAMKFLLDEKGEEVHITKNVVMAAMESGSDQLLKILLDRRPEEINITEDVLLAVAGAKFGRGIMKLLLDKRGSEVRISDEILRAAVSNGESGGLVKLLLDERGSEISVTEDLFILVASGWDAELSRVIASSPQVMKILLEAKGAEITITENILKAAAGGLVKADEVVKLLLAHCGDEIHITADVLETAARGPAAEKVMKLLLDAIVGDAPITDAVMRSALGGPEAARIVSLWLDARNGEVEITHDMLEMAAGGPEAAAVMKLFLEARGEDIHVTHAVLRAAAGGKGATAAMKLFLDARGGDIHITPDVVMAAAGSLDAAGVMKLLLDARGGDVHITESLLKIAVQGEGANKVLDLLIRERGADICITADLLRAAMLNRYYDSHSRPVHEEVVIVLMDERGEELEEVIRSLEEEGDTLAEQIKTVMWVWTLRAMGYDPDRIIKRKD